MNTTLPPPVASLPDVATILATCITGPCMRCGTGHKEIDHHKVGQRLRAIRERRDLSLREVAMQMGHTPPYLSDLELGRRPWNAARVERYLAAVGGGR